MNQTDHNNRGGVPVGKMKFLPRFEAGVVFYLRLWSDGTEAQSHMRKDFTIALGREWGTQSYRTFQELCRMIGRFGHRPMMRHHLDCECLGADENVFANFVAAAAEGSREDAMMLASLIVRPDAAPMLTSLAEDIGHALRSMTSQPQTTPLPSHTATAAIH